MCMLCVCTCIRERTGGEGGEREVWGKEGDYDYDCGKANYNHWITSIYFYRVN